VLETGECGLHTLKVSYRAFLCIRFCAAALLCIHKGQLDPPGWTNQ
jgi:hypothetical protein